MKIKSKTSKLFWEILIILFISITIIASILADFSLIKIPNFFALRISNKEDLMFNLFTTQATLATISIAIIALASGVVSESILGISITRYISQLRPRVFKHQRLIILSLVISFINYFAVSYNLFNTSIAIFLLSVIISVILVKDLFLIFLGRREIKQQIESYIVENYSMIGVDNFKISLLESDNITNIAYLRENLDVIKKIFEKEIILQSGTNKSQLLMEIESIISDAFIKLYEKKMSDALLIVLDYICDFYEIANSKDDIVALSIWDNISREFFNSMKLLSEEQLYNSTLFYKFHSQLYTNQKIQIKNNYEEYLNCYNLRYYNAKIYYTLIVNNSSSVIQYNRKKLVELLYDDLYNLLFYSKFKSDKSKTLEILIEFCIFIKALIDEGEKEILNNKFFVCYRYLSLSNEYQVAFITACIYLYYVACREDLLKETKSQKIAKQILEENHNNIETLLYHINLFDFISKNLFFVKNQMQMWEVMPHKSAKFVMMDTVINDFFVFTALYKYWNNDQIIEIIISLFGDQTVSIFTYYFSNNNDNTFITLIDQYDYLFFGLGYLVFYHQKSELLKDILSEKYKREEIASGKENEVTDVTRIRFEKNIEEAFQDKLKENSYLFDSELEDNKEYTHHKICLCEFGLPSSFINDSKLDDYIINFIHSALIQAYICVLENALFVEKVEYNDRTKQKTLIKLIKDMGIDADTFIGNRDMFWGEEDKYMLNNFIDNMKQIKFPDGYNHFYLIDHTLVHCNLSDFSIEFSDFSQKDIDQMYKKDDNGKLLYNITNDIFIPFDQTELEEHIHRTRKIVRLYAQIHYRIESDKVGAGIQIIFD